MGDSSFKPPSWAAPPQCRAWLEVRRDGDAADAPVATVRVDGAPFTTFGRSAEACDVHVDDSAASRLHAAIVHHQNGKVYLIDLSSGGTKVDDFAAERHRPLHLRHGFRLRFGGDRAALTYTLHLEEGAPAPKRAAEEAAGAEAAKRARPAAETVSARHLLVKHAASRRPSSWKETTVTRSEEEALDMVLAFRRRLEAGEVAFEALAAAESHCSSAKRGGDLGAFGRGKMTPPFEAAAFALAVGELSGPVHSDSGVHLILRYG